MISHSLSVFVLAFACLALLVQSQATGTGGSWQTDQPAPPDMQDPVYSDCSFKGHAVYVAGGRASQKQITVKRCLNSDPNANPPVYGKYSTSGLPCLYDDRCDSCPAGSYSPGFWSWECVTAPSGTFVGQDGLSEASPCPVGAACPYAGTIIPIQCKDGMYADANGLSECKKCPAATPYTSCDGSMCLAAADSGCPLPWWNPSGLPAHWTSNNVVYYPPSATASSTVSSTASSTAGATSSSTGPASSPTPSPIPSPTPSPSPKPVGQFGASSSATSVSISVAVVVACSLFVGLISF